LEISFIEVSRSLLRGVSFDAVKIASQQVSKY